MPFATSCCNRALNHILIQLPSMPSQSSAQTKPWHCISLQINGFSLATDAAADILARVKKKQEKHLKLFAEELAPLRWRKRITKKKTDRKIVRVVSIYVRVGRKSKTWNCVFSNLLNLPLHGFSSHSQSLSLPRFRTHTFSHFMAVNLDLCQTNSIHIT